MADLTQSLYRNQALPLTPEAPARRTGARVHVALATGFTVAVLLGSQTLAILGRTVSAKAVQIVSPAAGNAVSSAAPKPKPSLNLDGGSVSPSAAQPAPFSLSSRQ